MFEEKGFELLAYKGCFRIYYVEGDLIRFFEPSFHSLTEADLYIKSLIGG